VINDQPPIGTAVTDRRIKRMERVHREIESPRDPGEVWSTIGDFFAIHTWCPWVKHAEQDASRPNVRIVTFPNDSVAREEIIEETAASVRYRVLDETGMLRHYEGVLAVAPGRGGAGALVTWDASFECDEALKETLCQNIGTSFEQGLAGLAD
jgi:hypothetical protein